MKTQKPPSAIDSQGNREVKHDVYSKWQTEGSCVSHKHENLRFFNLSHSFEKLLDISRRQMLNLSNALFLVRGIFILPQTHGYYINWLAFETCMPPDQRGRGVRDKEEGSQLLLNRRCCFLVLWSYSCNIMRVQKYDWLVKQVEIFSLLIAITKGACKLRGTLAKFLDLSAFLETVSLLIEHYGTAHAIIVRKENLVRTRDAYGPKLRRTRGPYPS